MKKAVAVVPVILFAFSFVSCGTIKICSDKGSFSYVVPDSKAKPKEVRTKMVWYALWGLIPISDNTTKDMINAKEKVTVQTTTSFIDFLISVVTGIVTIQSRTATVEVY